MIVGRKVVGRIVAGRNNKGRIVVGRTEQPAGASCAFLLDCDSTEASSFGSTLFTRASGQSVGFDLDSVGTNYYVAAPTGFTNGTANKFTPSGIMAFEFHIANAPAAEGWKISCSLLKPQLVLKAEVWYQSGHYYVTIGTYTSGALSAPPEKIGFYIQNDSGEILATLDGAYLGVVKTFVAGTQMFFMLSGENVGVSSGDNGLAVNASLVTSASLLTPSLYPATTTDICGNVV